MGQHGFARDMEFEKIGENSYVLKSNEETLLKFPFKFELYISYVVEDSKVITKYKVVASITSFFNDEKITQIAQKLKGSVEIYRFYRRIIKEFTTKEEGGRFEETVRPIFEDGCGENGYYDINISWDSGIAIVMDIVNQFVKKMW